MGSKQLYQRPGASSLCKQQAPQLRGGQSAGASSCGFVPCRQGTPMPAVILGDLWGCSSTKDAKGSCKPNWVAQHWQFQGEEASPCASSLCSAQGHPRQRGWEAFKSSAFGDLGHARGWAAGTHEAGWLLQSQGVPGSSFCPAQRSGVLGRNVHQQPRHGATNLRVTVLLPPCVPKAPLL